MASTLPALMGACEKGSDVMKDYDYRNAAMLLIREIIQHDPHLIGASEWRTIFNKALAIKIEADKQLASFQKPEVQP